MNQEEVKELEASDVTDAAEVLVTETAAEEQIEAQPETEGQAGAAENQEETPVVVAAGPVTETEASSAEDEGQDPAFVEAVVEALVFASGEPLSIQQLSAASGLSEDEIAEAIKRIEVKYAAENFGFELVDVAGKHQFRTKAPYAPFLRELKADRPRRLSAAALETLSVIAYRQPVVKSDIEKIRGVDVTPTLKTLLERSLVKIVGHQQSVGQPALYGTTEEFLKLFGMGSLAELPTLRDLRDLEKDPGETREPEEEAKPDSQVEGSESEQVAAAG